MSRSTPPALLAPPDAILLQARTGRPVLFDATTFSLISYVPELGPTILRMHHSLYGYDPLGIVGAADGDWRAVWRARDYAAWTRLSKRYAFGIVLAPAALPLRIPHHTDAGPTTIFRME